MNNENHIFYSRLSVSKSIFMFPYVIIFLLFLWRPPSCGGPGQQPSLPSLKSGPGSRHGWVHMLTTQQPSVTLNLHNFDMLYVQGLCTVAWQLARFQLTWRIARSLGDSWASCFNWATVVFSKHMVATISNMYWQKGSPYKRTIFSFFATL